MSVTTTTQSPDVAAHVAKLVASAPELSAAQRARLAALLAGARR